MTWPKSVDQLPPMLDYNIRHGRTYMYFKGEPLFPFGYGLSYTTFAYSNLRASSARLSRGGEVTVNVDVKNTGNRAGDEVVQLYVTHEKSSVIRPIRELRGFERIALQPGKTSTVQLHLRADSLGYWDEKSAQFVLEPEPLRIMVGASIRPGGPEGQPRSSGSAGGNCSTQEGHTGADRSRLGSRSRALDGSDSGDHEIASLAGERLGGLHRPQRGRSPRN